MIKELKNQYIVNTKNKDIRISIYKDIKTNDLSFVVGELIDTDKYDVLTWAEVPLNGPCSSIKEAFEIVSGFYNTEIDFYEIIKDIIDKNSKIKLPNWK
jgi:hypothetical protein